MSVVNFMINPNKGVPKFWAGMSDGSCIFGSLVRKGVKRHDNGAYAAEKRREGYVDIPIGRMTIEDNHVEEVACLSTGQIAVQPGLISAALIQAIINEAAGSNINLSGTHLHRFNRNGVQAQAAQPLPTFSPPKGRKVKAFNDEFDPNKNGYSF